jgi:RND family efflux transporter MFP subunit
MTDSVKVTGEIQARAEAQLSFRVAGRIMERHADVGQFVRSGDLLARIDAEEQKADIVVAQANLDTAQAQEAQAQATFGRQRNLAKMQVSTQTSLDQAQENLVTAQGNVTSAQAQLATARETLSYTELRADADGVITTRNVEVGQIAQAAQQAFTLARSGPLDAVFLVNESVFLGEKLDDKVRVALLSDPARTLEGHIRETSPVIDSRTGTVRVKVAVDDTLSLPLGAPAIAEFRTSSQNVIELPWSAMSTDGGRPAVWIVDTASSSISLRPVEVKDYETGKFAVEAGVSPGDVVVVDGTKFLRPGQVISYDKAGQP